MFDNNVPLSSPSVSLRMTAVHLRPLTEDTPEQDFLARLERLPRLPRRIGLLLGSGLLFDGFDTVAIAIMLSPVLVAFGLSSQLSLGGLLIGIGYLGQLIGSLLIGYLSDCFGRKRLFLLAACWFGLLSLFAAFAPSFPLLLTARFVQGIGLGGCTPVATTLYSELVPGVRRGAASIKLQALYALGFILAPVAFLPLVGLAWGWRLLLGLGALPLVIALLAAWGLPESVRWLANKGRTQQAALILSRLEQETTPLQNALVTGYAYPVGNSTNTTTQRTRIAELFSRSYRRRTALVWLQWFASAFTLVGLSSWLPTLYIQVGASSTSSQALNILYGVMVLLVLWGYSFTADRWGRKRGFVYGFGLVVLGALVGLVVLGLLHAALTVALLAPIGMVMSIGAYLCTIQNFTYTAELFPTRIRTWALACAKGWSAIASVLSPVVIGILVSTPLGLMGVFALLGLFALLALLASALLTESTQRRALEAIAP